MSDLSARRGRLLGTDKVGEDRTLVRAVVPQSRAAALRDRPARRRPTAPAPSRGPSRTTSRCRRTWPGSATEGEGLDELVARPLPRALAEVGGHEGELLDRPGRAGVAVEQPDPAAHVGRACPAGRGSGAAGTAARRRRPRPWSRPPGRRWPAASRSSGRRPRARPRAPGRGPGAGRRRRRRPAVPNGVRRARPRRQPLDEVVEAPVRHVGHEGQRQVPLLGRASSGSAPASASRPTGTRRGPRATSAGGTTATNIRVIAVPVTGPGRARSASS